MSTAVATTSATEKGHATISKKKRKKKKPRNKVNAAVSGSGESELGNPTSAKSAMLQGEGLVTHNRTKRIAQATADEVETTPNRKRTLAELQDVRTVDESLTASIDKDVEKNDDQKIPNETSSTKKIKALERVKNQIKMKKLELEDRLKQQQQQQQAQHEKDKTAVGTSIKCDDDDVGGDQQLDEIDTVASASRKAKDLHDALQRAKSKLHGALKNRHRVLKDSIMPTQAKSSTLSTGSTFLRPLSALSSPLLISGISKSGPSSFVYFESGDDDLGLKELKEKIGSDMLAVFHNDDELMPESDDEYETDSMEDEKEEEAAKHTINPTISAASLALRKQQLQKELIALKQKLDSTQRKAATDEIDLSKQHPSDEVEDSIDRNDHEEKGKMNSHLVDGTTTKEALERRKAEVQTVMDITYWKHFVSRQQVILAEVKEKVTENAAAIADCFRQETEIKEKLKMAEDDHALLDARRSVVEKAIGESLNELLASRRKLHLSKRKSR
jgi:hypothetical protein